MSKELPKGTFDLDLALEQRVREIINKRLNEVLSQARTKIKREARMSLKPRDQKDFERAVELVDMLINEVNWKGLP